MKSGGQQDVFFMEAVEHGFFLRMVKQKAASLAMYTPSMGGITLNSLASSPTVGLSDG